jgi:hypothetical protein
VPPTWKMYVSTICIASLASAATGDSIADHRRFSGQWRSCHDRGTRTFPTILKTAADRISQEIAFPARSELRAPAPLSFRS